MMFVRSSGVPDTFAARLSAGACMVLSHWRAPIFGVLYFSPSEIACRGQSRIANFTFSISPAGGFSISTCAWSSRTSNTSGAAAAHRSFPSQSFRSTTIIIIQQPKVEAVPDADAHPQAVVSQSVP
jgi:hypothetical protein